MKANYHTHTIRCNHAYDCDEAYVKEAIKGGFQELGFSDHACWQYKSNFTGRIRMKVEEFDDYYQSLSLLKEKYKDQISIKIGLECEYFPAYMDWLKQFIKDKHLDYIILGNHFHHSDENGVYYGRVCNDDAMLTQYVDDVIEGLETGLYSYLAHPDLFMRGRSNFDEHAIRESMRLCQYCKEHNVPLEFNLEGMHMNDVCGYMAYPHDEFWKVAAEVGNDAIIGVDAHDSKSLSKDKYWNEAVKYLEKLGIRRLETIDYKW